MRGYDDDLRFAHVLADEADAVTMARFGALDLTIDTKPDHSPVTDADRAAETTIRSMLRRARPRDAVHGEELEDTGYGPRRWVIDPIDGTKNYLRGVPVWATLIGLMDGDRVVAAVVSAPALNRRWWAATGTGAWTGRSLSAAKPCRVSTVSMLSAASVSYSSLMSWEEAGRLEAFLDLLRAAWRNRAYGDFWSHMLVAEGTVDVAAEVDLALHDIAAVSLIVTEAGGRYSDFDGAPGPHDGKSALCSNGLLHEEVMAYLRGGLGTA